MSNSDKRRGKLGASFFGVGSSNSEVSKAVQSESINTVPLEDIDIVPNFNPRTYLSDNISEESIIPLADSIKEHGILQPLAVRRENGRLKLIAGERRLRAAKYAELKLVPVIELNVTSEEALQLAIIENAQREDIDVVSETLLGFELMSLRTGMNQDDVVAYLNSVRKGRREDDYNIEHLLKTTYGTGISLWSQRRSLILKMNRDERDAIRKKHLDVAVVIELLVLPDGPDRARILERASHEKLSASQTREIVRALLTAGKDKTEVQEQVQKLRKNLSRIAKLKGTQAERARVLLVELNELTSS